MSEIPEEALSDHFKERVKGRNLVAAVFLTFRFEPGFFEQEVLPVFLDVPLSHARDLKLAQLEDALRTVPHGVAVYYDAGGLVDGDAGPARLDVRRVPIRHPTGVFHPKNVLALVEAVEADDAGQRARSLLVGTMSANLTRAGWWENVEACHVEEITSDRKSRLRDPLRRFLNRLRQRARLAPDNEALDAINAFLGEAEAFNLRSFDGVLEPHFFDGRGALVDWLDEVAGDRLRATSCLEILTPYFDDADQSLPLEGLLARLEPRSVRISLPRAPNGAALLRPALHDSIRALASAGCEVGWGRLPREVTRLGRASNSGDRLVHAKVYRFFSPSPKREYLLIGSLNLTKAAHGRGGNVESAVLVECLPERKPEFWLVPETLRPETFTPPGEVDEGTASASSPLVVRWHWDKREAVGFWDADGASPPLVIDGLGRRLGEIESVPARAWTGLPPAMSVAIGEVLASSSFLHVTEPSGEPALVLVQEEALSHAPSLLLQLSAADILRYWSLLTAAQRAAFLESRAPERALLGPGADLVSPGAQARDEESFFDRFAGMFHAFACLDRHVREAMASGREKDAAWRVFGRKYDSLGRLLERVLDGKDAGDDVERHVLILCASQLLTEVEKAHPELWAAHRADADALRAQLAAGGAIRERLLAAGPEDLAPFLAWFDANFVRRARGSAETAS